MQHCVLKGGGVWVSPANTANSYRERILDPFMRWDKWIIHWHIWGGVYYGRYITRLLWLPPSCLRHNQFCTVYCYRSRYLTRHSLHSGLWTSCLCLWLKSIDSWLRRLRCWMMLICFVGSESSGAWSDTKGGNLSPLGTRWEHKVTRDIEIKMGLEIKFLV